MALIIRRCAGSLKSGAILLVQPTVHTTGVLRTSLRESRQTSGDRLSASRGCLVTGPHDSAVSSFELVLAVQGCRMIHALNRSDRALESLQHRTEGEDLEQDTKHRHGI